MAVFLYLLDLSLSSPEGFAEAAGWFDSVFAKLIVLLLVAALLYHLIAGIKHLLMDIVIVTLDSKKEQQLIFRQNYLKFRILLRKYGLMRHNKILGTLAG